MSALKKARLPPRLRDRKAVIKKTLKSLVSICILGGGLSAWAQTQSPNTSGQIGPGTAGTISATQGVTPTAPDKPHQVLSGALTKQTRQTLWEAMNSATPGPEPASSSGIGSAVTIGPGEGAEMSGNAVDKIAFANLPATVKSALGGSVQGTLSSGSGR